MEIDYSDGQAVEEKILELLDEGQVTPLNLGSDDGLGSSTGTNRYDDWALKYHLSPLRHNLFLPFDFSGLTVLEVGGGLGALSTHLVRRAAHLTVVEGTHRRFSALSKRLQGFQNWNGIVGNFEEVVAEPVFDVVCVVGVLEYAGLFFGASGEKGAYREFLAHAKRFLKPGGILFLAIENKLGTKYFSGAPEDHTGKLFDGICGYTNRRSPKTFARLELLKMLNQEGYQAVREFYPYPDYKFPETLLTPAMMDEFPGVAITLGAGESVRNGSETFPMFPETLLTDTLARAGVLKDFANSLLFVVRHDSKPETMARFLRETGGRSYCLGWSFHGVSESRCFEEYLKTDDAAVYRSLLDVNSSQPLGIAQRAPVGVPLRVELVRASYQGEWGRVSSLLLGYFSEVFRNYSFPESNSMRAVPLRRLAMLRTQVLRMGSADETFALWCESYVPKEGETPLPKTVSGGTYILAGLIELKATLPFVLAKGPHATVTSAYHAFCDQLGVPVDLENDFASYQKLYFQPELSLADLEQEIRVSDWPRSPQAEFIHGESLVRERNLYFLWMTGYVPRLWRWIAIRLAKKRPRLLIRTLRHAEYRFRALIALFRGCCASWSSELVEFSSVADLNERQYRFSPRTDLPKFRWSRLKLKLPNSNGVQLSVETDRGEIPLSLLAHGMTEWSGVLDINSQIKEFVIRLKGGPTVVEPVQFSWTPVTREIAALLVVAQLLRRIIFSGEQRQNLFRGIRLKGLFLGLRSAAIELLVRGDEYAAWYQKYEDRSEKVVAEMVRDIEGWGERPVISILVPVCDPPVSYFRELISSIEAQVYENWELCLADDASANVEIDRILTSCAEQNSRIRVVKNGRRSGIANTTNAALSMATGEIVVLVDHDDLLSPDALYHVARAFVTHPEVAFVYSDEDKIDISGRRYAPHFKPQWNPLLLYGYNYVTHLTGFRTDRLRELGGLREGFEGSQDHDLILRYTERLQAKEILHIPFVLYHWRAHSGSVALSHDQKPQWVEASRRAIQEHFLRMDIRATIGNSRVSYLHRVKFEAPLVPPRVSVMLCTRDRVDLLKRSVGDLLAKTDYPNFQLILVDNQSTDPKTLSYFEEVSRDTRVRVIKYDGPFNFSAMNNFGAAQSDGELLLLLNNDVGVIHSDWLTEMVSYFSLPEVAAVGPKLYYANNRVQHAGLVLGPGGVAGHCEKGVGRFDSGYFGWLEMSRFVSGVTGACLLVRSSVFRQVCELDALNLPVAFNDVDLCLKIRDLGLQIVFTPFAELYHFESATRGSDQTPKNSGRFAAEVEFMKSKWGRKLIEDPLYSPNLTVEKEDFSLAFPPRVKLPWKNTTPRRNRHSLLSPAVQNPEVSL